MLIYQSIDTITLSWYSSVFTVSVYLFIYLFIYSVGWEWKRSILRDFQLQGLCPMSFPY